MIWRVCERWGFSIDDFYNKTDWEQAEYLAYENIREMEDVQWPL